MPQLTISAPTGVTAVLAAVTLTPGKTQPAGAVAALYSAPQCCVEPLPLPLTFSGVLRVWSRPGYLSVKLQDTSGAEVVNAAAANEVWPVDLTKGDVIIAPGSRPGRSTAPSRTAATWAVGHTIEQGTA